jgi:hypothetical protein
VSTLKTTMVEYRHILKTSRIPSPPGWEGILAESHICEIVFCAE